jgi:hypothetical protein
MNCVVSVQAHVMRKSRVSPALIPTLVEAGLSDSEIARKMGWTVGTLRVRCSQLKISLRRKTATARPVILPQAILDQLQQRAALMGTSVSALAAELLEVIARDGLYAAVLDRDEAQLVCANEAVH